jgi:hypothetical protein
MNVVSNILYPRFWLEEVAVAVKEHIAKVIHGPNSAGRLNNRLSAQLKTGQNDTSQQYGLNSMW